MLKKILLLSLLFSCKLSFSQSVYEKLFNTGSNTYGHDICQIDEHRFILTGKFRDSQTNLFQAYALMINDSGDTLWSKLFQSTDEMDARNIKLSVDSTIIIGGTSGIGIFIIKLDLAGQILLSKTINFPPTVFVDPEFSTLPDSGLMVGAVISSLPNVSSTLIKLDKNFNVIWDRYYSYDIFLRNLFCDSTGCIICGDKTTGVNLLKVSPSGSILWTKRYDFANDIQSRFINKTASNDFLIGGIINNFSPYFVAGFILKVDSVGNDVWSRVYFPGVPELLNSIQVDNNNFIIVSDNPFYFNYNTSLFSIDSVGRTQWAKCYKTYLGLDRLSAVSTYDNHYIIAASGKRPDLGQNISSIYLLKTDQSGNSNCSDSNLTFADSTYLVSDEILTITDTIANLNSQNFSITATSNFTSFDICNSISTSIGTENSLDAFFVYPNPFTNKFNVFSETGFSANGLLTIYDYSGSCILKMKLTNEINEIDLSWYANGIYHINIKDSYRHLNKNIIKY